MAGDECRRPPPPLNGVADEPSRTLPDPRPSADASPPSCCRSPFEQHRVPGGRPSADPERAMNGCGQEPFDKLCELPRRGRRRQGHLRATPRRTGRNSTRRGSSDRIIHGKHGDHAMPPYRAQGRDRTTWSPVNMLRQENAGRPAALLTPLRPRRSGADRGRPQALRQDLRAAMGHEGVGGRAPDFKGAPISPPK